jgi:hypothetical protein
VFAIKVTGNDKQAAFAEAMETFRKYSSPHCGFVPEILVTQENKLESIAERAVADEPGTVSFQKLCVEVVNLQRGGAAPGLFQL